MTAIFGEGKFFWKLPRVQCLDTLCVDNFDEIALSRTVKEIEANLCFAIFGKNSKIQNGRHFWGRENFLKIAKSTMPYGLKISTKSLYLARLRRLKQICVLPFLAKIRKFKMTAIFGEGKIFWKLPRVQCLDTLCVDNFDEIALSRTVKEIEANLCFAIFGKNSKIQNGRHFWGRENFLKIAKSTMPYGLKISTKSLYLARLRRQKQICVLPFLAKIRKFKMTAIFGEGKIFWKLPRVQCLDTLCVDNFDEIALSRTVKEIEANLCFAIFGKNSKIQNGRHFWGRENFLKIAKSTMLRYPMGWKFRRNRSISHG